MTFEKVDRELTELCFNVKKDFMDWSKALYMGNKDVPEGRLDDPIGCLGMAIGYLNDVRIELFQMASYQKGYEKGLNAAKEA